MPSPDDCATLQAYITGVDRAAREAEAVWGLDRLPTLVDDELRAKFNRQGVRWRAAMEAAWESQVLTRDQLDAAAKTSAAMQRAWRALADAASEAGHRPVNPDIWEVKREDGRLIAFVRTTAEASAVVREGRYHSVYTVAEIRNLIDALPAAIAEAKHVFPDAKVLPPSDRSWVRDGDSIPFGEGGVAA